MGVDSGLAWRRWEEPRAGVDVGGEGKDFPGPGCCTEAWHRLTASAELGVLMEGLKTRRGERDQCGAM